MDKTEHVIHKDVPVDVSSIGPLMIDVEGLSLTKDDRLLLANTHVGGVILFSRNYSDHDQLLSLVSDIRQCNSNLLIAVDHEGGRVQRFRDGFTRIPPMKKLGECYEANNEQGISLARDCGWLLASELRAFDIDFSFAPVLDLDYGVSSVIGDRAFSGDKNVVSVLAQALIEGMAEAGMASTGKHFPGHGAIEADSHVALPEDGRAFDDIEKEDVVPFKRLIAVGLNAIMPAHVIYTEVDDKPAGFSTYWLKDVLRKRLAFDGVIFSDDLSMEGASVAGDYAGRVKSALAAGCDMALVCNDRPGAVEALEYLEQPNAVSFSKKSSQRLRQMKGEISINIDSLRKTDRWKRIVASIGA